MPTLNPRLTITLEPTLAAQLRRLSELTGNSQSKLISELLEGSTAIFAKLIRVLEAAEKAKAEVKGRAAANLEEAQGRMETQLQIVMEDFDSYTGSLLAEVEGISRRARKGHGRATASASAAPARAPVATVLTPPSNRGVRSTANPRKTAKAQGAN